ncbi:ABC transporter permease [Thermopirellula anaerolimosa]
MVSVLHRRLLRELRGGGMSVVSIVLIAAVGTGCYVAMRSAHRNLSDAKNRYYAQGRMADFWIQLKKVPTDEVARLRTLPWVTEIQPRIRFPATVDLGEGRKPISGLALSLPDTRRPVLNDVVLRMGGYFTPGRRNEVIVNHSFAEAHGLKPGSRFRLLLQGKQEEVVVVGTAMSCEFVYALGPGSIVPDRKGFGIFYLKRSFAEEVFQFEGAANELIGRLSPGGHAAVKNVLQQIERMLDDYGVLQTTPLADYPSNNFLTQEIEGLATFGFAVPMIFLVVTALVLNVMMIRRAGQERTVVGTLKALGYSDAVVAGHFLEFSLWIGLLGGLAGCVLGAWMAQSMTSIYQRFYEFPSLVARFHADIHVQAVIVAVACAGLGGWHGTRSVMRLRPADAMRPRPPRTGRVVFLERFPRLWNRLSAAWRIVLRNILRHRVRSGAGVAAGMLGAAVMAMIFSMAEAVDHLMAFHFRWVYRSDLTLGLKDEQSSDVVRELLRLEGVRAAEPSLVMPCVIRFGARERTTALTGITAGAAMTVPREADGRKVAVPPAGLLMSRALARILGAKQGDAVAIRPLRGSREWRVARLAGLMDDYVGTTIYADIDYLRGILKEESAVNRVQMALDPDPQVRRDILFRLKDWPAVQDIIARADIRANLENTLLRNLWLFLSIEILFAGSLFFGAVLNSAIISMTERRQELATLQVLGYSPWQVGGLLARESLVLTLAGIVLGLPLGYALLNHVVHAYQTEVMRIPSTFPPQVWARTVLWGTVFGMASQVIVQRAVHAMPWLEAIKVRE